MNEAIDALAKLLTKVDNEQWVNPIAKRYILSGIRMSILYLHQMVAEEKAATNEIVIPKDKATVKEIMAQWDWAAKKAAKADDAFTE
jgi:hypothetical protein